MSNSTRQFTGARPGAGINDKASRATRVLTLWGTPHSPGELHDKPSSIAVRLSCSRRWVMDCLRRHGRIVGGDLIDDLIDDGGMTS